MASSISMWIFQTAVLLCLLIMMAEGLKCYQCAAPDSSCKQKGPNDQAKECDCSLVTSVLIDGKNKDFLPNNGCNKVDDKNEWTGCYWYTTRFTGKDGKASRMTVLGCALSKKDSCESEDIVEDGVRMITRKCHCSLEGCNSRAGQILTPKSFFFILTFLTIILRKLVLV